MTAYIKYKNKFTKLRRPFVGETSGGSKGKVSERAAAPSFLEPL